MTNIYVLLDAIDPTILSYEEWLSVGMAVKHEGGTSTDWDTWSQRDPARYHAGECVRKWAGFMGSAQPITAGSLVVLAKRHGWTPARDTGSALSWDAVIAQTDLHVIDTDWIEDAEVTAPADWNPIRELSAYIGTLFSSEDHVGYVTESWTNDDGRQLPKKGSYARTAGEILDALGRCSGDIGAAIGDYDPEAGAWIRFNPLDGKGVRDANVTAYRYALIESDTIPIEKQAAIYQELELPVAALVHSGGKSLHAIVKIDATSKEEYRDRVQFLHAVCAKNGLDIDTQNKNPSRLSRMPGVLRQGRKQYLVGLEQGKASWAEWQEWVEELNDNLPDFECLDDVWDCMPDLAAPLIDGILREGHKLLLSGPSKAGKSYMLLQLAIAVAEGREWLGWSCTQGRVLYVNLELDARSCWHRIRGLYDELNIAPRNRDKIDVWNLRGNAVPMDSLAPKLIRRALQKQYSLVIIDPIYKVITGDENAADKMAYFCNQFDRVCAQLGAAVVYCHHHSKGAQGQKVAQDRSSGSGVFARDPDAILDVIELVISDELRKQIANQAVVDALSAVLDTAAPDWREGISQDDALVAAKLGPEAYQLLGAGAGLAEDIVEAEARAGRMSGWRVEGSLREFASFDARYLWFTHPIHTIDMDGLLEDAQTVGDPPKRDKNRAAEDTAKRIETISVAYQAAAFDGQPVTTRALARYMGNESEAGVRKARRYAKEHPEMTLDGRGGVSWGRGKS